MSEAVYRGAQLGAKGVAKTQKLALTDMGMFALKGIKGQERLYQCLPESLVHRTFPKPHYYETIPEDMLAHSERDQKASEKAAVWYEVVAKGKVSVRELPHGGAEELGILKQGDIVSVSQTQGDWMFVNFTIDDSSQGGHLVSGAASNAVNRKKRTSFSGDEGSEKEESYIEGWTLSRVARGNMELLRMCSSEEQRRRSEAENAKDAARRERERQSLEEALNETPDVSSGLPVRASFATSEGAVHRLIHKSDSSRRESDVTVDGIEDVEHEDDDQCSQGAVNAAQGDDSVAFPQFHVVVAGPLHLHSKPGVGGQIVLELTNGEVLKTTSEINYGKWLQIELSPSQRKRGSKKGGSITTGFLSKSKSSSRSVVRVTSEEGQRTWEEQ
tara:strand:- start:1387 stop:2544 length:1158 start_codon:yes stop_codon:yes gene_type:complete